MVVEKILSSSVLEGVDTCDKEKCETSENVKSYKTLNHKVRNNLCLHVQKVLHYVDNND